MPLHEYHDLSHDIERMKKGEPHVLWPGHVSWFAQSSGTVSGMIKHIPITKESLMECHYKGGKIFYLFIIAKTHLPHFLEGNTS